MVKYVSAFLIFLVRMYKVMLSPYMFSKCRYTPTCSAYMIDAINKYGHFVGVFKGVKRIMRCNPFGGSGYDPA